MKKVFIAISLVFAFTLSSIGVGSLGNTQIVKADTYNGYSVYSIQSHLNSFRAARNSNWAWWDDVSFARLAVDGKYGSLTRAAVAEYQSKKGLVVDGIVGAKTWAKLKNE